MLLRQLIEDPASAEIVRSLAPDSLTRLIDYVGLEDAGEIVAYASTEQILNVFDTDLWLRERGGGDGEFRPERFLMWLEILSEAGEKALVSRLTDLPEDLVIAAFFAHMLVLNLDDLGEQEQSWSGDEIDLADKALLDCITHELDEYCLVARKADGWDTILHAVLALYEHEPDLLNRILSRCCYASSEYIEDNGGLYDVLSAEEMLLADAAADRDDRRAEIGYVAPSDATALFKLALGAPPEDLLNASGPDPITRAYFRNFDKKASESKAAPKGVRVFESAHAHAEPDSKKEASKLAGLLRSAGILNEEAAIPLLSASKDASKSKGGYQAALKNMTETDPAGHERRVGELIYLANVVEARFGTSASPVRPVEAARAVFDVLDVGLSFFEKTTEGEGAGTAKLSDVSPVSLFLAGLRILAQKGKIDSIASLRANVGNKEGKALPKKASKTKKA